MWQSSLADDVGADFGFGFGFDFDVGLAPASGRSVAKSAIRKV
jgi:hypothetical protein